MRILVLGAGVLGCNLARDFYKAGKDVTLLARGDWGKSIKENGLKIKSQLSHITSTYRLNIIEELKTDDIYDIIFVCMRYTQLSSIVDLLNSNGSKNIVFVGNNTAAPSWAKLLGNKNIMFGFAVSAGSRKDSIVYSIDMKKITIGDLKDCESHEAFLRDVFDKTGYKVTYEENIGDYLLCYAAFIIPACYACYYADGDLKRIKKDKEFIDKVIKANIECYEAIEKTGHELRPDGEEKYRDEDYYKSCIKFFKLMCGTFIGKICISDHAMCAAAEMKELALQLEDILDKAQVDAPNYNELKVYIDKML